MDVRTIYGIQIIASKQQDFAKVRRTLRYLRLSTPRAFVKVQRLLRVIVVVPHRGYYNEAFVKAGMWVTERSLIEDRTFPPPYLASLLLHEAHHVAQFQKGKIYRGAAAERKAYEAQRRYLQQIKFGNAVRWLDVQYKRHWWRSMDKANSSHRRLQLYMMRHLNAKTIKYIGDPFKSSPTRRMEG